MPVPLDCAAVGDDGSVVTVGVCQPIRRFEGDNAPAVMERRIWVIRSNGTIDESRTEGFNRALDDFQEKHKRGMGDCYTRIAFYTGDRLGIVVDVPRSPQEASPIDREMGILVLRADGSYEGLYYALAASKSGALFTEDPRQVGIDAQREWLRKQYAPENLVEYIVLDEDNSTLRDRAPAYPEKPLTISLVGIGRKVIREITLQTQRVHEGGKLLVEPGARIDSQGRLYIPGRLTRRQIHPIDVPDQQLDLGLEDGYVIARFKPDGQFDGIVARLKIPVYRCRPWQLWDIDASGNLYSLEFEEKGVVIRMVSPTPAQSADTRAGIRAQR